MCECVHRLVIDSKKMCASIQVSSRLSQKERGSKERESLCVNVCVCACVCVFVNVLTQSFFTIKTCNRFSERKK